MMKIQLIALLGTLIISTSLASIAAEPVKKGELYTTAVTTQGDASVSRPKNSQTKEEVAAKFGEPLKKVAAIGEPPISRWEYGKFNVFFEDNLVIHTVLKK
jgi:hypothetical protein